MQEESGKEGGQGRGTKWIRLRTRPSALETTLWEVFPVPPRVGSGPKATVLPDFQASWPLTATLQ